MGDDAREGSLVGATGGAPDESSDHQARARQTSPADLTKVQISLRHEKGTLEGCAYIAPGGARPAILVNCGCYSGLAGTLANEAPFYATRGYAYVLTWNAGTREEIADHVFQRWHADAAAILDWLEQQHWCDGRVGTHGVSLIGSTAYAAVQASLAEDRPAGRVRICACAPALSFSRIQPTVYLWGQGLAVELVLRFRWLAELGVREGEDAPKGLAKAKGMVSFFGLQDFPGLWNAVRSRPINNADEAMWGRTNRIWRSGLESRLDTDPFWLNGFDTLCNLPNLGERCPPIHLVTGWWDIFLNQTLADFAAVMQTQQNQRTARLLILSGGHFGAATRREIPYYTLAWYDTHVLGLPQSESMRGPVCLEVIGGKPGEYLEYSSWPPAVEMCLTFFASVPDGVANPGRIGVLVRHQPGVACKPLHYVYDPRRPTPYAGGGWLNFRKDGPKEQRSIERRSDVAVLTSDPLVSPLTLVGMVSAMLFIRASVPECDVVARLCVVRAPHGMDFLDIEGSLTGLGHGKSFNLCERLVRVKFQQGVAACVEIDVGPTCCRINAGDRIRLQICSAAHPKALRHPLQQSGDWLGDGELGDPAVVELFTGKDGLSCVKLPIASHDPSVSHQVLAAS